MKPDQPLLAVPNVSEGRVQATVRAIAEAFTAHGRARLLDVHSDEDHHRSVFTLAGAQGELSGALLRGAAEAVERIDVGEARDSADVGEHPHVGAVDVMPVVYLDAAGKGAACAEALVVGQEIGEGLGVPVFLYGELAHGRTRAELRSGGVAGLAQRLKAGGARPDFGPSRLHPTAGATLVAAREPLVAFNIELAPPAGIEDARRIASLIREGGSEGLEGVRAIGVPLSRAGRGGENLDCEGEGRLLEEGLLEESPYARAHRNPLGETVAQVSMNVERPLEVPLKVVVEAVRRHTQVACAELVGLAPRAAFDGFPQDVPLLDFDPGAHLIENALGF
jgi:glutamate formiminotransferase/glutamate formiminotransferase/formiminotetrahydrofolate cyclodeaminase